MDIRVKYQSSILLFIRSLITCHVSGTNMLSTSDRKINRAQCLTSSSSQFDQEVWLVKAKSERLEIT